MTSITPTNRDDLSFYDRGLLSKGDISFYDEDTLITEKELSDRVHFVRVREDYTGADCQALEIDGKRIKEFINPNVLHAGMSKFALNHKPKYIYAYKNNNNIILLEYGIFVRDLIIRIIDIANHTINVKANLERKNIDLFNKYLHKTSVPPLLNSDGIDINSQISSQNVEPPIEKSIYTNIQLPTCTLFQENIVYENIDSEPCFFELIPGQSSWEIIDRYQLYPKLPFAIPGGCVHILKHGHQIDFSVFFKENIFFHSFHLLPFASKKWWPLNSVGIEFQDLFKINNLLSDIKKEEAKEEIQKLYQTLPNKLLYLSTPTKSFSSIKKVNTNNRLKNTLITVFSIISLTFFIMNFLYKLKNVNTKSLYSLPNLMDV